MPDSFRTTRGEIVLLDGGTGSELRARGIEVPSHITSIWSAQALDAAPEAVFEIHRDYLAVGADVITANNYAVTPPLLAREGLETRFEELTRTATALARRARDDAGRGRVAGSMPPLETSYRADLVLPDDVLRDSYRRMAEVLASEVDLLLVETMSSAREAVAALGAARETDLEVWCSWTLQTDRLGQLPSGETITDAFAASDACGADAYLVNCCGANFVTNAVATLAKLTDKPIGGYANAADVIPNDGTGESAAPADIAREILTLEGYTDAVAAWLDAGATIVGGCCSTRPAHIERLRALIDSR